MAEFDRFAKNYAGGMEHPLKKMAGAGLSDFIAVKARWLIARYGLLEGFKLLDFGCGNAIFLKVLRQHGVRGALAGCDVSSEMLREANAQWPAHLAEPQLSQMSDSKTPYPDKSFDFVVASGVMHHVEPRQRLEAFMEMKRLLRPGGRLILFEHNPYNPVTQWVVRNTAIDEGAVLLRPAEVKGYFQSIHLTVEECEFLLFFPPRLSVLQKIEPYLSWLPMGGQYVVVGRAH